MRMPIFKKSRRYWFRLLTLATVAVVLPVFVLPIGIGWVMMWNITHPGCYRPNTTPADYQLSYRDIAIPAHIGGVYHGYFIPGTKDATIIVPPTYSGSQAGMLPEASLIAQDGYNVLMFESRVCAGQSAISLGYNEVDDVGDALAYLRQNPDHLQVNMDHIALHGFSSAGATVLMAGARYPEIHAVLAEGGYHNMDAYIGLSESRGFGENLLSLGAKLSYRVTTGHDSSVLEPVSAVSKIPPRPLFLIYGTTEPSYYGGTQEYAAALADHPNANVHLWSVPKAWHGGYITVAGKDEYKRHVLPFYDCALLNQCDAWNVLWSSSTH